MLKKILLLSICWVLLYVTGCGQSGPLYLPTKQQQEQKINPNKHYANHNHDNHYKK